MTINSERRRLSAGGLHGASPGQSGINQLYRAGSAPTELPAKTTFRAAPGDVLVIETPGGGGWQEPSSD